MDPIDDVDPDQLFIRTMVPMLRFVDTNSHGVVLRVVTVVSYTIPGVIEEGAGRQVKDERRESSAGCSRVGIETSRLCPVVLHATPFDGKRVR
jgi:hypothetical protein